MFAPQAEGLHMNALSEELTELIRRLQKKKGGALHFRQRILQCVEEHTS